MTGSGAPGSGSAALIRPPGKSKWQTGHHLADTVELPYNVTLREQSKTVVIDELTL